MTFKIYKAQIVYKTDAYIKFTKKTEKVIKSKLKLLIIVKQIKLKDSIIKSSLKTAIKVH